MTTTERCHLQIAAMGYILKAMPLRVQAVAAAIAAALVLVRAEELTLQNWEEQTSGKSVFVKFFAPWCGHCKAMKPDWDKLMTTVSSKTTGIFDVDCTGEGQSLCEKHGVKGYPALKWGDPSDLQDYAGERTFEALSKFADEKLGPQCGPTTLEFCDEATKALIQSFMDLPLSDLKLKADEAAHAAVHEGKAYSKKRSKFNDEYSEFMAEVSEDKDAFEKKKAKASKKDIEKQEKKTKKVEEQSKKLAERTEAMNARKTALDSEKEAMSEKVKKVGLKHMKAVLRARGKSEL